MTVLSVVVRSVVVAGMVVVMPLGLRLLGSETMRRWWPFGAVPGAIALWLPRGVLAAALETPYALVAVALALTATRDLWQRLRSPVGIAVVTALVSPTIAAVALVAERAGYRLFGFSLDILSLTVAHFHFAGFSAALVSGLLASQLASSGERLKRWGDAAAVTVPVGTGVVLVGHFVGDWVEFAGAVILTCGMWLVGWLTWREVRPRGQRVERWLFGTSAAVLVVTMLLALEWSLGQATGIPHLDFTWMAATHGLCNAFGFGLCAVLAWWRTSLRTPQRSLPTQAAAS